MDNERRKKINILAIALFLLFIFPLNSRAEGASFYFSPNSGTFYVGSTFDVSIFVNTGGNNINAVGAEIKFDPKKIQIANPTTGRSFISVWVAQPAYSNTGGTASFQGGVPSPGVNTSSGLISTITFRAIAPGETTIYFSDSSRVLLNDGKGTNILSSMSRGVYNITMPPPEGPKVYSSTHPDQNKWYKNNNPTFSWEKEEGFVEYSYSINNDFGDVPDNVSEGSYSSVSYTELGDGIWYFHVKAKKGDVWGGTSHYIVQIDSSPPASFIVDFEPKLKAPIMTSREPIISFITTDALSGIDHYELKVIDFNASGKNEAGFFTEVSSPYKLPSLSTGEHEIVVRAFDVAGNWKDNSQKIEVIPAEKAFYFTKTGMSIWMFFFSWGQVIVFLAVLIISILILSVFWWKKDRDLNEKMENLRKLRKEAEENSRKL